MCDEITEAENAHFFEHARLTRRAVSLSAGATAALLITGCASTSGSSGQTPGPDPERAPPTTTTTAEVVSERVTIETPDGTAEGFFVSKKGGSHPGVLVWPDVAGLREAYETMATRLASAGYAVLVVNCYYRSSKLPIMKHFDEWRTDEGRAKIKPMREALTPERIAADGAAYVSWLDTRPEVDTKRKVATTGYCMGGPFTFHTAAAAKERVGVLASFHGGGLVTDDDTSPHLLLSKMGAAALVCIAENDDAREPEAKDTLKKAAADAGRTAEIEVYPAQHGWCTIDSPVYDEAEAERAWSRMLAMFAGHL